MSPEPTLEQDITFSRNSLQNTLTENLVPQLPDCLVVTRTFFPKEGGIEEYVYNRCLQDPQQVRVLTAQYPDDRRFDQRQSFPVHRWWMPKAFPPGAMGGLLKQFCTLLGSFGMALWLYRRHRYHAIEWGHGYDFPSLLVLSYLLPIKYILYLHGNDVLCPLGNPLLRSLFAWTLRRMDVIVCNSEFTRDYLLELIQCDTPIHVIHPTVRPDKFGLTAPPRTNPEARKKLRVAYHIPDDAIVLLSVGRLIHRKGFDRVIQYLPPLLADGLDVHYIVCGRGALEPDLKALAERLGVSQRVHFAGYVSDFELADYFHAADLFAMLTRFDVSAASIEGFGIVYREASFFGKPILATRVGGVEDAVLDGETGILVPPHAEQTIVDCLRQLCQDGALRDRLGRNGSVIADQGILHRSLYHPSPLSESRKR
jgi:glycosyltransferase involved in cell wall biosynthesis